MLSFVFRLMGRAFDKDNRFVSVRESVVEAAPRETLKKNQEGRFIWD
jgi:hypothetical protein